MLVPFAERRVKPMMHRNIPGVIWTSGIGKPICTLGYREYFLLDDELHGYEDFDATTHQPPRNVGERGKSGTYVNNFMFVHNARATSVFDKLRSRGLKVV